MGGFQARIRVFVEVLKELGYDLYFIYLDQGKMASIAEMKAFYGDGYYHLSRDDDDPVPPPSFFQRVKSFLKRKISGNSPYVSVDIECPNWAQKPIQHICESIKPDFVVVNLVFLSKVFEWLGDSAEKVLDVHDKFADRHKVFEDAGRKNEWHSISLKDERKACLRADKLIAIQEVEKAYFQNLTHRPTYVLKHYQRDFQVTPTSLAENPTILFVASKGAVNASSYERLVHDIFPKVKDEMPDAQLIVVGNINTRVNAPRGVFLKGYVESLREVYEQAWVVVNPVDFGTGLKIKNLEALARKKALVTTPHGAIGIEAGIDKAFLCAENDDDFSQAILTLLQSSEKRRQIEENALPLIQKINQEYLETMKEIFS